MSFELERTFVYRWRKKKRILTIVYGGQKEENWPHVTQRQTGSMFVVLHERWKRSAWILRRSLAVGTLAAWVARHDGVSCGHEEKDGGRGPPLMGDEGSSPAAAFPTPVTCGTVRMMRTALPRYICTVFETLVKLAGSIFFIPAFIPPLLFSIYYLFSILYVYAECNLKSSY